MNESAPLWSSTVLLASWVLWLILGLIVGSAMNALIHRLPLMLLAPDPPIDPHAINALNAPHSPPAHSPPPAPRLSLWWPRSHCPLCLHPLGLLQLLPVLSFLRQGGRCHFCKGAIAPRYLWVEILSGVWWCWCAWRFMQPLGSVGLGALSTSTTSLALSAFSVSTLGAQVAACALWSLWGSLLIALAAIDWEHQLLPDALTQLLLWAGLIASGSGLLNIELHASLWGAVLGYGSFAGIALLYQALSGREGLGQGDFKLLGAMGAWLGPWALIPIVFMASLSGLLLGLGRVRLLGLAQLHNPMPFGPFLVLGAVVTLVWGPAAWLSLLLH